MSAAPEPLTAEEIEAVRRMIGRAKLYAIALSTKTASRLCDVAESAAAKDAEIAGLRQRIERLSTQHFAAIKDTPIARECADYATSLRSAAHVIRTRGKPPPPSFLRAADLMERAAIALTELPSDVLRQRAERAEADAGRYRWLRAQHWSDNTISAVSRPKDAMKLGHDAPSGGRLDDAIDAAIAASQPAEGEKP